MKYKLLTSQYTDKLSIQVQKYLDDGWKLRGNTFSNTEEVWGHFKKQGEITYFSQAVIKDEL
jgi:hypothetical protein